MAINGTYDASSITVLEGLEAVRMREKEEAIMTSVGLPRGASYVMNNGDR